MAFLLCLPSGRCVLLFLHGQVSADFVGSLTMCFSGYCNKRIQNTVSLYMATSTEHGSVLKETRFSNVLVPVLHSYDFTVKYGVNLCRIFSCVVLHLLTNWLDGSTSFTYAQ